MNSESSDLPSLAYQVPPPGRAPFLLERMHSYNHRKVGFINAYSDSIVNYHTLLLIAKHKLPFYNLFLS
jgi:hypothetical protein